MAAGRNSTQPTYDFLTGASSPPPPSFRETLRTSHVVRPGQLSLYRLRKRIVNFAQTLAMKTFEHK